MYLAWANDKDWHLHRHSSHKYHTSEIQLKSKGRDAYVNLTSFDSGKYFVSKLFFMHLIHHKYYLLQSYRSTYNTTDTRPENNSWRDVVFNLSSDRC